MKSFTNAKNAKTRATQKASFDFTLEQSNHCGIPLDDVNEYLTYLSDCGEDDAATLEPEYTLIMQTIATALHSPMATALFEEAAKDGWAIDIQDLDDLDFHLDVPEKCITLNSHGLAPSSLQKSRYFRGSMVMAFVRSLRDIWQEKRHGGFETHFNPQHVMLLERIRAADCETMLVVIAWEIEQAGTPDLWRHLIGSSEGDMAMAFTAMLEKQKHNTCVYDAMNAAFKQWFLSDERINICDHETLEYLDNIITTEGKEAFGTTDLNASDIEMIAYLPNHFAYLQGLGEGILNNALYTGMNDIINQSHLMHIMEDMQSVQVAGIAFRDAELAAKIFPQGTAKTSIDA